MNKVIFICVIIVIALFLVVNAIALENMTNTTENITEPGKEVTIKTEFKMSDAQKKITFADRKLSYINSKLTILTEIPNSISTLLDGALIHLESAKKAFEKEKYGEAFGQANSATQLIKNAEKTAKEKLLFEDLTFEDSRTDNPSVPEGWFYTIDPSSLNTNMISDLNPWNTGNFSIVLESYLGDNSILLNTNKNFCCFEAGYIQSKDITIDSNKTYYLEFYTKTNYTLYSTGKGNVGYHAYLIIYFDDALDNLISQLYVEWNQESINIEDIGTNPQISIPLEYNTNENGWNKAKIKITNLNPSIVRARIIFSEYYPENSVNVLIDDISISGG